MTYHQNGKLVGVAGLGAYTGFNTGPVGKEIVARGGSVQSSDLKAYASAGAGVGGAALCTAYGGAAVAPFCAQAASAIAEVLVGNLGSPATAAASYTLVDIWNGTRKIAETAGDGAFKIRAYLTMRDQAIDDVAQGSDTVRAWADQRLSAMGIPAAPIRKEWAPRQDLWDVYKETAIWATNPIGAPPGWPTSLANVYRNVDFETFYGKGEPNPWGYGTPSVAAVSKQVGLSSEEMLTLIYYPTGPMAAPGEPINFGVVGAWEAVARKVVPGSCALPFGKKIRPPDLSTRLTICWSPPKSQMVGAEFQYTNGLSPSQEATKLIFALQEAKVKLKKEADTNSLIKVAVAMAKIKKAEAEAKAAKAAKARSLRNVLLLAGAGTVGAGAWWLHKKRR